MDMWKVSPFGSDKSILVSDEVASESCHRSEDVFPADVHLVGHRPIGCLFAHRVSGSADVLQQGLSVLFVHYHARHFFVSSLFGVPLL